MKDQAKPIRIRQEMLIEIPQDTISETLLSVPSWDALAGRGGIIRDRLRASDAPELPVYDVSAKAKLPYDEHLKSLALSPQNLLLIISARNLGNNLRVVAWHRGKGLLELSGEHADSGTRAYPCLCSMSNGKLEAHALTFAGQDIAGIDGRKSQGLDTSVLWAVSGQPIVWNGSVNLDAIIRWTYDQRHIWSVPSGRDRFGTRSQKGRIVEDLITALVETEDAEAVKALAARHQLERETDYFHSAVGVTPWNSVVIAQLHGSFEMVAERLLAAGATHAIELDEGGSVSTHFVQKRRGQTSIVDSRIIAGHYFRPKGSALIVFKLKPTPTEDAVPTLEDSSLGQLPTGRVETIADLRQHLDRLDRQDNASRVAHTIWMRLPKRVQDKIQRTLINELVSARLSVFHYTHAVNDISRELREIEADRSDESSLCLEAYESDVDRAYSGCDAAEARLEATLEVLSHAFADES